MPGRPFPSDLNNPQQSAIISACDCCLKTRFKEKTNGLVVDGFIDGWGAVTLSVGGLRLVRRRVTPQNLREHHDVAGFILAIVGVIYAVLLAFVVLVVWEQFEDARVIAEHEANAVLDIYRLAPGFGDVRSAELRKHLHDYAQGVVNNEWTAMGRAGTNEESFRAVDLIVDNVWADLIHLDPQKRP